MKIKVYENNKFSIRHTAKAYASHYLPIIGDYVDQVFIENKFTALK